MLDDTDDNNGQLLVQPAGPSRKDQAKSHPVTQSPTHAVGDATANSDATAVACGARRRNCRRIRVAKRPPCRATLDVTRLPPGGELPDGLFGGVTGLVRWQDGRFKTTCGDVHVVTLNVATPQAAGHAFDLSLNRLFLRSRLPQEPTKQWNGG